MLLEADSSGWAKGLFKGVKGWFPEQYVQEIEGGLELEEENEEGEEDQKNEGKEEENNNIDQQEEEKKEELKENLLEENKIEELKENNIVPPMFDPSMELPPPPEEEDEGEKEEKKTEVMRRETMKAPTKEAPKMEFDVKFLYDRPQAKFEDINSSTQSTSYITTFLNTDEKKEILYQALSTDKELLKTGNDLQLKILQDLSNILQGIIENEKIIPSKNQSIPPVPKNTLEQFRSWIKEFSKGKVPQFGINSACGLVLRLAQQLNLPQKTPTKEQIKNYMPTSKKEHKINGGESHMFLLDCIYDILVENSRFGAGVYDLEVLEQVPQDIIIFCMDSLMFVNPLSVRNRAGECLGILSNRHFQFIKNKYFDLIGNCTKDDSFRMLSTYQRALPYLNFGFEKEEQAKITLEVIFKLRDVSKKLKASVFRLAICDSFLKILTPILKKREGWVLNNIEVANLQASFTDFFDSVKVWFKKGKTKLSALKFLSLVFCNLPDGVINHKNEQLIPIIVNGLSNKLIRHSHFEFLLDYFQSLPHSFVQTNYALWEKQINALVPYLLEKKQKNVDSNESKKLTAILIEIGKKDFKFIGHPHIKTVLTNDKEYTVETQGIVLNAIGVVYDSRGENTDISFASQLYPIITSKVEAFFKNTNRFLSPVLFCFPHLCEPSKLGTFFDNFIKFSASEDPEFSVKGVQGLQNYLLLNDCENFERIVSSMVYYLRSRIFENNAKEEEISTHFRNLSLLFNTYLNKKLFDNLKNIKAELWTEIRKNLEVCVLYCILKQDAVLITDALTFLDLFCVDTFVRIDVANSTSSPYLNQYFNLKFWNQNKAKKVYYENFLKDLSTPWNSEIKFIWNSFFKNWNVNNEILTNFFALTLDSIIHENSQEHKKMREEFLTALVENTISSSPSSKLPESLEKLPISTYPEILVIISSLRIEKEKKKSKEILQFEVNLILYYFNLFTLIPHYLIFDFNF